MKITLTETELRAILAARLGVAVESLTIEITPDVPRVKTLADYAMEVCERYQPIDRSGMIHGMKLLRSENRGSLTEVKNAMETAQPIWARRHGMPVIGRM